MTTMITDLPLTDVKIYTSFDDMDLPMNLLRGIYAHGFEKPSEIQKRGIVPIKNGNDLMAQAQSGTGKTGTFCIGALTKIDITLMKPQVIVIVPTRELAQQIEKVAQAIGLYMELKVYSATGGTPIREDLRALERGVHFISIGGYCYQSPQHRPLWQWFGRFGHRECQSPPPRGCAHAGECAAAWLRRRRCRGCQRPSRL